MKAEKENRVRAQFAPLTRIFLRIVSDRNYCVITIAPTALKVLICSPVNTPGTILLERSFYSSEGEVPGTQVGKMHPTDPVKFIEY